MKIKFIRSITLIDGNGVTHSFKEGRTCKINAYWGGCFIRDGSAVSVEVKT